MLTGIAALIGLQLLGEVLASTFKLPIPGPVIGLALLAGFAIWRGAIPQSVSDAGDHLLRYLSLLFVPAGVGLIAFYDRLLAEGARLLLVLVVSTAITMLVTALTFHVLTRDAKNEEKP
jgi:holin-like protein